MSSKVYFLKTFFLILLFSHNVAMANDLPDFTAKYAIQKFGIKLAEAKYKLSRTESGYTFSQNTKLFGFASMFRNDTVAATSSIDKVNGELLLKKYSYKQTGEEENKNEDISINWDTEHKPLKGKITGIVSGRKIEYETTKPVWEALSFQIPLMLDADEKKKSYRYSAIIQGEIDTYDFELVSQEAINFANKDYQTLHVVRTDPLKDRQLHLWLAPELNNLPILIENYRDGKEHSRMQLESVQFKNETTLSETESDDDF